MSEPARVLEVLPLPSGAAPEGTIGGVPLEALLSTAGTGGGRRRAGLLSVAELLAGFGVNTVGLCIADELVDVADGVVRATPLPEVGGSLEWVGDPTQRSRVCALAVEFTKRAPSPGESPALWTLRDSVVVDLSIGGRRPGFCLLVGPAARLRPVPVPNLPLRPFLTAVAGMLRADAWRRTIERLVETLARTPIEVTGPVTSAQEAAAWAAQEAEGLLDGVSKATGHPLVSVHLPDPDDGLVWDLAMLGGRRRARHAGVSEHPPDGLPFDWVAAEAMTPAAGAGQAVVRRIGGLSDLRVLLAARGLPEVGDEAGSGPWTVARRPLSRSWSPSRRNLVVVLAGRPACARWSEPPGPPELGADEQGRLSALVERVHDRVMASLAGGLARWRDTLRASVLVELERQAGPDGVARALRAGLGAGAVTLWRRQGDTLTCAGSAGLPASVELPDFSLSDELLDPREHGLLRTPLFRSERELSDDGFLRWEPMVAALGASPRNVGTVPLRTRDGAVGLLRVDDVRAVFSGLVSGADAPGLRGWLPDRVPAHAREVLDDVARWFALAAPWSTPRSLSSEAAGPREWRAFMAAAKSGQLSEGVVRSRLEELASQAPTRGAAADLVGIHRNTLRRHMDALSVLYGASVVPWV